MHRTSHPLQLDAPKLAWGLSLVFSSQPGPPKGKLRLEVKELGGR